MAKQAITEQDGAQNAWYAAARQMTLADVPEFLRQLSEDFEHDYGTICHALAAGALAAAHALDHSDAGGITGFQGGEVMWQFVKQWLGKDGKPLRLTDYEELLYPQYADNFQTIAPETWAWVQERARALLADDVEAAPRVVAHWQSIVAGEVPFGLTAQA